MRTRAAVLMLLVAGGSTGEEAWHKVRISDNYLAAVGCTYLGGIPTTPLGSYAGVQIADKKPAFAMGGDLIVEEETPIATGDEYRAPAEFRVFRCSPWRTSLLVQPERPNGCERLATMKGEHDFSAPSFRKRIDDTVVKMGGNTAQVVRRGEFEVLRCEPPFPLVPPLLPGPTSPDGVRVVNSAADVVGCVYRGPAGLFSFRGREQIELSVRNKVLEQGGDTLFVVSIKKLEGWGYAFACRAQAWRSR